MAKPRGTRRRNVKASNGPPRRVSTPPAVKKDKQGVGPRNTDAKPADPVKSDLLASFSRIVHVIIDHLDNIRVRFLAVSALIGLLLGYIPIYEAWKSTTPKISMNVDKDGVLETFEIENRSGVFNIYNYTPDCEVNYALWKISGNIVSLYTKHEPPELSNAVIGIEAKDNFLCNLANQIDPPIVKFRGLEEPATLLEVQFKIVVRYETKIGIFRFPRKYESDVFCGILRSSQLHWSEGFTTVPRTSLARRNDIRGFYSGNLNRCFSEEEVKNLLGYAGGGTFKAPRAGYYKFKLPPDGPFGP